MTPAVCGILSWSPHLSELTIHTVKGNPYQQLGPHSGTDEDAQGTLVCLSSTNTSHITRH